jgi:hypothetical protein
MEKLTDVEGKPVFINANRVTHVTINIETNTPEIHFVGGSSTTVADQLTQVLAIVSTANAVV